MEDPFFPAYTEEEMTGLCFFEFNGLGESNCSRELEVPVQAMSEETSGQLILKLELSLF